MRTLFIVMHWQRDAEGPAPHQCPLRCRPPTPVRHPPLPASPAAATAVGSLPTAVKAAAALAFVSAVVDVSGGKLVGSGMVDDGATPPRRIYPYTSS